jgi:hydrogenase maturation protease
MGARVPVFVCGEPARGDDGAGPAAVELLPADARERAEIVEVGQLDVLLLLDLPADAPCVVVDAVSGIPAGEVWVRPLAELIDLGAARGGREATGSDEAPGSGGSRPERAAGSRPQPRSSHELPVERVLALAATLRDAPPRGTFVGIGGAGWNVGTPLSAAVAAALPAFAAAIAAAITELAGTAGD